MIDSLTSILENLIPIIYVLVVIAAAIGTISMLTGNDQTRRTGRGIFYCSLLVLVFATVAKWIAGPLPSPWITWTEFAAIVTIILCLLALLIAKTIGRSPSSGQPSKSKANGS